jgi:hypothetical protein
MVKARSIKAVTNTTTTADKIKNSPVPVFFRINQNILPRKQWKQYVQKTRPGGELIRQLHYGINLIHNKRSPKKTACLSCS